MNIMLADAESSDIEAIRRSLMRSAVTVELHVAETLRDFIANVAMTHPAVVLMDSDLPDGNAVDWLACAAEERQYPVLVMSSRDDAKLAVQALKAGALDYVVKSSEAFDAMAGTIERMLREWESLRSRRDEAQVAQLHSLLRGFAFPASPGAIIISDIEDNGRLLAVNDAFEETFGFTRNEVIGKSPLDLGIHLDRMKRDEIFERLERDGCVNSVEFRFRVKTGEVRDGVFNAVVATNAQRRRVICVLNDITEQKKAQLELQQRLEFETLMATLAAKFLDVSDDELARVIDDAQAKICECFAFERSTVWQLPPGSPNGLAITHAFATGQGRPPHVGALAREHCPWTLGQLIAKKGTVLIPDVNALPPEAARDQETFRNLGIACMVAVPWCSTDATLVGAITFSRTCRSLPSPVVIGQLETLAQLILVVLGRARERRARTAGQERMRLLNEILDEAPVGILVNDSRGHVLYANEHSRLLHGYTAEEFTQLDLRDLIVPDHRDRILPQLRKIIEVGDSSFTAWHVRKDGSPIHLALRTRRILWSGETAILCVQTDLTERERSAEALRESQARYQLLAENITDVIWLLDPANGRFEYVSPSVFQLRGYTAEEVMGQPFEASLTPESLVTARQQLFATDQGDQDHVPSSSERESVYYQPRKDGSAVPTEVRARYVREPSTARPLILGVSRDITERLKAEQERAALEQQLHQAQKMEAIGQLAGGVAHDFNNILSVIRSYTRFAMDAVHEGDPLRADLLQISKAGERAAALTRQLLVFCRKQIVEPRVLDVNQVVSGIEKMLSRLVGEDIDIQVRLADGIGHVVADPWQIEQVIMNLTVNARDAMPHGGRLVIQTAESNLEHAEILPIATMQRRTYVVLSVADTGCGMDEATRARIFEPFYTTKMVGKGTGLGLATVYGIVKQSGGDVAVETEVGRGTTFSVYLPREDAPATVTTRRSEPVTGTGHGTVLVVEDEDAVREIVVRSLRGAGYEILSARSGGDALVLCEKWAGRIDLLLTDVVMPQMSGPELAQRLTQQMPSLKVLFMSGYPDDSIVHHGVLNTGVRLISKPYETTELARVVRDVLDEGACVELQDAVAVPAYDSIGDTVGPNS